MIKKNKNYILHIFTDGINVTLRQNSFAQNLRKTSLPLYNNITTKEKLSFPSQRHDLLHVRESGFQNPGNPWNQESWFVESRIQLKESGIPLTIGFQNLSSSDKDWNPQFESAGWNLHGET